MKQPWKLSLSICLNFSLAPDDSRSLSTGTSYAREPDAFNDQEIACFALLNPCTDMPKQMLPNLNPRTTVVVSHRRRHFCLCGCPGSFALPPSLLCMTGSHRIDPHFKFRLDTLECCANRIPVKAVRNFPSSRAPERLSLPQQDSWSDLCCPSMALSHSVF